MLDSLNTSATGLTGQDTASKSEQSRTKLAENLDTFLVMLTTQLKNQDPLSPMESTEFTNQLVQFANVEQGINSNQNLEKLIGLQSQSQSAYAVSYLGTEVEATNNNVPLQNGAANFRYALGENASEITIVLQDNSGRVVRMLPAPSNDAGAHTVEWDGKDAYGNQMEDGNYKLVINAKNGEGEDIDVATSVFGRVTGVSAGADKTLLTMGDTTVDLDDVLSIKEAAKATTDTAAQ